MTWMRGIRVAIVVLALLQIGIWVFAGWLGWDLRYLMIGPGSPEVIGRERFAIALFISAAINLIAVVAFLLGFRWGWLLLILVQLGDLVFSVVEALSRSTGWWLVTVTAAVTTVLLLASRRLRHAADL